MCGIVGMAGNGITFKDQIVFKELLQVSIVRGHHGTGIFEGCFTDTKAEWFIEKKPIDPVRFLDWAESGGNKKVFGSLFDNVYIGHARYATVGALTAENCHPFRKNNIVGVHNGTLEDVKYWSNDKTDSELLYEDIQANGAIPVLKDLSPDSAYALVWFDLKTHELNFVRSAPPKTRTLYVVANNSRDVIYWASEYEMLEWVLIRNNINFKEISVFTPNKLYSIKLDAIDYSKDLLFEIEEFTPRKFTKKEIKQKKKQVDYLQNYYASLSGGSSVMDWDNDDEFPWYPSTILPTSTNVTDYKPATHTIIPKSGKIPHVKCDYCTHEMSLLEQYFSKHFVNNFGDTVYECARCEEVSKQIAANMTSELETKPTLN